MLPIACHLRLKCRRAAPDCSGSPGHQAYLRSIGVEPSGHNYQGAMQPSRPCPYASGVWYTYQCKCLPLDGERSTRKKKRLQCLVRQHIHLPVPVERCLQAQSTNTQMLRMTRNYVILCSPASSMSPPARTVDAARQSLALSYTLIRTMLCWHMYTRARMLPQRHAC